jgi:hypothetical protein
MAKSFVVFRLKDAPKPPTGAPAAQHAPDDPHADQLDAVRDAFGVLPRRVFESLASGRLGSYYEVEVGDKDRAEQLAAAMAGSGLVARAYVRATYATPHKTVNGNGANEDGERRKQPYLRPGPTGINAFYAWDHERTRGQNVRIADIEEGFDLGHPDLPRGLNVNGNNNPGAAARAHGLAVLGVVAARDSQSGLIGISPQALAIPISYFRDHDDTFNLAWAMDQAVDARNAPNNLGPGDILLIEAQVHRGEKSLPVEVEDHIFDAIRHLTDLGILVIEPAGNSEINLDGEDDLKKLDDSGNPAESGALMVSGTVPKERKENNEKMMEHRSHGAECAWGSRVDCFAWGDGIRTLGNPCFGGTSGASAIIAGAAALLQTVARRELKELERPNPFLRPKELRDLLSHRGDGIPAESTLRPTMNVDSENRPIGVMPDLEEVIGRFLSSIGIVRASYKRAKAGKTVVRANKVKGKVKPAAKGRRGKAKTGKKSLKVAKKTKAARTTSGRARKRKAAKPRKRPARKR